MFLVFRSIPSYYGSLIATCLSHAHSSFLEIVSFTFSISLPSSLSRVCPLVSFLSASSYPSVIKKLSAYSFVDPAVAKQKRLHQVLKLPVFLIHLNPHFCSGFV